MALGLSTVTDFVTSARTLLQDTSETYRYSDNEILTAMNIGLLEARRLRPDLFPTTPTAVPSYTIVDGTAIAIDGQYLPALLYYVVGHCQLRDEEGTMDARAGGLMNRFVSQLVTAGA